MVVIDQNTMALAMVPGDKNSFTIKFTGNSIPDDGAEVLFSVKKKIGKDEPKVLEKRFNVANGCVDIAFDPRETCDIDCGAYKWDIRVKYSDDDIWTPMMKAKPLEMTGVVGDAYP